jgi:hypothetical protein
MSKYRYIFDLFIESGLTHSRKTTVNKYVLHSFIARINNALNNNVL